MCLIKYLKCALVTTCALLLSINVGLANGDRSMTAATGDLGKVDFPISCSAQARSRTERGLALLHHMMYALAKKEFKALAKKEPDCAMTHWGIAMTLFHPLWPGQPTKRELIIGSAAVEKAKRLNPPTKREQAYIAAVEAFYRDWETVGHPERIASWEVAQKKVYQENPDDIDAATLYALSHLATAPKADKTFAHQKKAGALLENLYAKEPRHPGVIHYMIHAYDNPMLATRAVKPARAYDKIAPDVPHALHMPTHIFVRLGIWPDVIGWNVRSAKAALKYPANKSISHHYPHALDYLIYAYLQGATDKKAEGVLQKIKADSNYQKTFVSGYALAAIPARYYLERKQWGDGAALEVRSPSAFPWEKFPQVEAITYFARGLSAARNGDAAAARMAIETLDVLYERSVKAGRRYWAVLVDAQRKTVAAWITFSKGKKNQALQMIREAADLEDSVDKHPVTPGAVLPARELLGDMLVLLGKYPEAIKAYEASLEISPNRFNSLYGAGRAAEHARNSEKAKSYYSKLVQISARADSDRAEIELAKKFLAKK